MKILRDDITVYLCPLPMDVHGYTVFKDMKYTIVINENLCQAKRIKTYRHEMYHIEHDDFFSCRDISDIEREAHNA